VKPNLIGIRGAWISGGIEWNTGPSVHTVTAVEPIESCLLKHEDGSASIAVGHVERVFRTHWTVVVTLRPGLAALEERIRLFNPQDEIHPYYFWNCTAVPNTEGMRFIYPMTLGTDHAGTHFYSWPVDRGVDLSWSKNYPGPSSIFAYECDQDFFGSYDYTLDRGVVAIANHHVVPGKKAWTWGQSGDSRLRQEMLTDDDGPYNEVQTGPLRTQADFGLLEPHQVLEWTERWYPVHGLGGYLFADGNAAFSVVEEKDGLTIKILTTSTIPSARLILSAPGQSAVSYPVATSPAEPTIVRHIARRVSGPWSLLLQGAKDEPISAFTYPLPLPVRTPPALPTPIPENQKSAQDLWLEGQVQDKQAQALQAHNLYEKALEKEPYYGPALCSLSVLDLEAGLFESALAYAGRAVERNPDLGMGWYWKAVALFRLDRDEEAAEAAWKAARFEQSAALGYGMLARLAIRSGDAVEAVSLALEALRRNDRDSVTRNTLGIALLLVGESSQAERVAADALSDSPLDLVAASLRYLAAQPGAGREEELAALRGITRDEPQNALEIVSFWISVCRFEQAEILLNDLYLHKLRPGQGHPIPWYYAGWLAYRAGRDEEARQLWKSARDCPANYVFPHRLETIPILRTVLQVEPTDSQAALYLGNLLFAKGQLDEGRECWSQSVRISPGSSVAFRNLGHAADRIDRDVKQAIQWYEKALKCDPNDPTLCRDLAGLYKKDGKPGSAIALLERAVRMPNPRADVAEMLAESYSDVGRYADAIRFLESTSFYNWEARYKSHELFVRAHIARGKQLLEAGDAQGALDHFEKSKTFPRNLAVGRGPHTREATSNYWVGMALKALGRLPEAKGAFRLAAEEPESREHRESRRKAAEELAALQ
jgi:tetratricopeptide (TPR) repeat protein